MNQAHRWGVVGNYRKSPFPAALFIHFSKAAIQLLVNGLTTALAKSPSSSRLRIARPSSTASSKYTDRPSTTYDIKESTMTMSAAVEGFRTPMTSVFDQI